MGELYKRLHKRLYTLLPLLLLYIAALWICDRVLLGRYFIPRSSDDDTPSSFFLSMAERISPTVFQCAGIGFGLAGKHKYINVGGESQYMDQLQEQLRRLLVQPSADPSQKLRAKLAAAMCEVLLAAMEIQGLHDNLRGLCVERGGQRLNTAPQDRYKHLLAIQLESVQDSSKVVRMPGPSQSQHFQAPSTPSSLDPLRSRRQPVMMSLQPREMQPSQLVPLAVPPPALTVPPPASTGRGNVYHISSRCRTDPEPDYMQYCTNHHQTQAQDQPLPVKPQPSLSLCTFLRRIVCCGE